MSGDLIAFVRARLDEDEAAAKEAWGVEWDWRYVAKPFGERPSTAHTVHIARHDPARVLRDIEADRKLLAALEEARAFSDHMFSSPSPEGVTAGEVPGERMRAATQVLALEHVVKIRAERFSGHPDYRSSWKP